jgi:2-C-methyl-D-erythritol 4-phosphate cytidylyltransferase
VAAVPEDAEIILVHDAARPFLSQHCLEAVLRAVHTTGAAALAVPVADTLRRAAGEDLGETVPRGGRWAMQTPQAARATVLRAAIEAAMRDGFEGTDEVELLERAGVSVRIVEGDARNLKLTTAGDWAVAEALFRMR